MTYQSSLRKYSTKEHQRNRCDSINNQIDSPLIKKKNNCVKKKSSMNGPLLLLILIFGSIATPVYSQQERRLVSLQNSDFFRRHDRRGRRLRGLKNDDDNKDNDKNGGDKEEKGDKNKTEEPTTSQPTRSPTRAPIASPSFHPSLSVSPSLEPSSKPTLVPSVDNVNMALEDSTINLGFSILFNSSDVTNIDIIKQENFPLTIASTLLRMFCIIKIPVELKVGNQDGFIQYGPCLSDGDGNNAEIYAYLPIPISRRRKLDIVDVQQDMGNYMEDKWLTVTRKVLDGNAIPYVEILVKYVLLKGGDKNSKALQDLMQSTLDDNIDKPEYLRKDVVGIQEIALVGNERASFNQFFSNGLMTPELLKRDLSPMHGIRVVGLIMLATVILTFIVIIKSAQRRHLRKEWDAMNMDKGKGGLGTQEGLDFMLDTGRNFDGIAEEDDVDIVINKSEKSKRGGRFA